jgi:hypothetical protein
MRLGVAAEQIKYFGLTVETYMSARFGVVYLVGFRGEKAAKANK